MKKILFITTNKNKLKEIKKYLIGIEIENKSLELLEIQGTPEEIIRLKLNSAFKIVKQQVLVEDTCLFMEAFNDLPGPYIKDFLTKMGPKRMAEIAIITKKTKAFAQCTYGYYDGKEHYYFKGIVYGNIVMPKGNSNFGWDSIFQPNGFKITFAEMTLTEKNKISHRSKATKKLQDFFKKYK